MEDKLNALLDELKLNMTIKRHVGGKYDGRIYHPWINNPILSAPGKNSFQECVDEFCTRIHAIENARKGIEAKNEKRARLAAQEGGNAIWDAEEYSSTWNDWY